MPASEHRRAVARRRAAAGHLATPAARKAYLRDRLHQERRPAVRGALRRELDVLETFGDAGEDLVADLALEKALAKARLYRAVGST